MPETRTGDHPLRVAVNAQISPGIAAGGVLPATAGLLQALGRLEDGSEEYVVIGPAGDSDWPRPYLGPNQRLISGPPPDGPGRSGAWSEPLKRLLGPLRPGVRTVLRKIAPAPTDSSVPPQVPVSSGFFEGLGCDVIHFPYQQFIQCALPAIYNPWDLQHLHYPQFFTASDVALREAVYLTGCRRAHTVVVASQWGKNDLVQAYDLPADKVRIIPMAPPTAFLSAPSQEQIESVKRRYSLQQPFALYPAVTWEHKNHLRLLDALEYLKTHDNLTLRLLCTGERSESHWPRIEERMSIGDLSRQVTFAGIVPEEDLRALYGLARFVVFPSLFEGAGLPMFEAWMERVPFACSTATMLPEQAGDAALLFDPFSVEAIADALKRMASDRMLRQKLVRKGTERLRRFTWERIAKAYRALYRCAAGRPLSAEDRRMLSWNWMSDQNES